MCIMMYVKRCIEPQARPQERREISGSDWAMASARWRARLGSRLGVQSSRRAVLLTRRGLSHESEATGQLLSIPLPNQAKIEERSRRDASWLELRDEFLCTLTQMLCVRKYFRNSTPLSERGLGEIFARKPEGGRAGTPRQLSV